MNFISFEINSYKSFTAIATEYNNTIRGLSFGIVPALSHSGVKVLDASAQLVTGPDARAFGSIVPDTLKGLESCICMNKQLAACPRILDAVLWHEEAHVLLNAVPECGWDVLEAELACDRRIMEKGTMQNCFDMISVLRIWNPSMKASGQMVAYEVNIVRMAALKAFIKATY